MEIKFFALLTLIPCSYIVLKFIKRADISCIDIVVMMHAVYLCVIPICGDTSNILYPSVRNDVSLQFQISAITFLFFLTMCFFDCLLKRQLHGKVCLFNISLFVREWLKKVRPTSKVYIFIFVIFAVLLFIALKTFEYSALLGSGSISDMRYASKSINTPFMMWLQFGSHILRLLMVVLLVIVYLNRKCVNAAIWAKVAFVFISISFVAYHFLISRTYFVESLLMLGLLLYSCYKDRIRKKHVVVALMLCVACFFVVMPIISGVKMAKRSMIISGQRSVSLSEMVTLSVSSAFDWDNPGKKNDNKASRSWYIYQIIGLALDGDYWGNGLLTMNAISYGVPKVIYPGKSMEGSQGVIENVTGAKNDVADSVLLLCVLENRLIAFVLASCYFLMAIFLYDILYKIMASIKIRTVFLAPVFFCSLFIFLNRVEYSMDNFIPSIEKLLLWYVVILCLMKVFRDGSFIKKA